MFDILKGLQDNINCLHHLKHFINKSTTIINLTLNKYNRNNY